jgi:hypothetical protein
MVSLALLWRQHAVMACELRAISGWPNSTGVVANWLLAGLSSALPKSILKLNQIRTLHK